MVLARTVRLGAGGLVLGMCALLWACGFAGVGGAPAASDTEAGAGLASRDGDGAASEGGPLPGEGGEIVIGDGDAAVDADGTAPDGAAFTCPSGCTSCTGTACNILCDVTHPCSKPITCPAGLPCHVTCDSLDACSQRTISCTNATSCRVDCSQVHACQTMGVDCGSGACRLDCTNFAGACVAVNLSAMSAASLCLKCDAVGGFPGCQATDGTKPQGGRPCNLVCTGGGCNANGNGLNGCSSAATCP
jgi:hypothetical protein